MQVLAQGHERLLNTVEGTIVRNRVGIEVGGPPLEVNPQPLPLEGSQVRAWFANLDSGSAVIVQLDSQVLEADRVRIGLAGQLEGERGNFDQAFPVAFVESATAGRFPGQHVLDDQVARPPADRVAERRLGVLVVGQGAEQGALRIPTPMSRPRALNKASPVFRT